jgi:hypothetical protein
VISYHLHIPSSILSNPARLTAKTGRTRQAAIFIVAPPREIIGSGVK